MSTHLQRNLDEIKKLLLTMGGMVEETIEKSSRALRERNFELAKSIANSDDAIDSMELKIDDECLKVLALHQPVAEDLRFVTTVLKVNNDLERIADLSANSASRVRVLAEHIDIEIPAQLEEMGRVVVAMLRSVLSAFLDKDTEAARIVCKKDDRVDQLHRNLMGSIIEQMQNKTNFVEFGVQLLWTSRNFERMADHVTNIAEDIVFMVEGQTIRHQNWREN